MIKRYPFRTLFSCILLSLALVTSSAGAEVAPLDPTASPSAVAPPRSVAPQLTKIERLERQARMLEAAGELGQACEPAAQVFALHPTAVTALRLGWLQLRAGRLVPATLTYERATVLDQSSLDAWLGLQRAEMARERWRRAAVAGDRLLALSPQNHWGLRRQALIRYRLGEWRSARTLYERALVEDADDALMELGLGLSLVRLGEAEAGHRLCAKAGETLRGDARVKACLATEKEVATGRSSAAAASISALGYSNAWNVEDVLALSVSAATIWPSVARLWLGATLSGSTLAYEQDDYQQVAAAAGGSLALGGWGVGASMAHLSASKRDFDGAWIANVWAARQRGVWRPSLSLTASTWSTRDRVAQLDAALSWHPSARLSLGLAPELILSLPAGSLGSGRGRADVEWLPSAYVWTTWRAVDRVELTAGAWAGRRRRLILYGGLSVWPNEDRFIGGGDLKLRVRVVEGASLDLALSYELGDEQAELSHDFSVFGGSIGIELAF